MNLKSALVTPDWLQANLENPNLIVLDASVPLAGSSASDVNSEVCCIPRSKFFDLDGKFSMPDTGLPHMMPSEEQFNQEVQHLGINQDSLIIVYDKVGIYSSPRIWWMFRAMGHENVAVLNGGLPLWLKNGYPTVDYFSSSAQQGDFAGKFNSDYFKSANQVLAKMDENDFFLLDARSRGRFLANEPEPRAGLRGGHIPNSVSLPFTELISDGEMVDKAKLKEKFSYYNLGNKHLTFSCGSGLTACVLALAAHEVGFDHLSVYDGSWSEWGKPSDLPVEP